MAEHGTNEPIEPIDDAMADRLGAYFDAIEGGAATAGSPAATSAAVVDLDRARRRRRRATAVLVASAAAAAALLLAPGDGGDEQPVVVGPVATTTSTGDGAATTATAPDGATTVTGPATTATTAPTTTPTGSTPTIIATTAPPGSVVVPPPLPPSTPTSSTSTSTTSTSTTLGPPVGVLVSEDFESTPVGDLPAGWTVDTGTWRVALGPGSDHQAANTTPGSAEGRLSTGSSGWTDARATVRLRFGATGELGGVALRYQGPGAYYFCKVDHAAQKLYLGRFTGTTATVLQQAPITSTVGQLHQLELRAVGTLLTCSASGGPNLQAADATYATGRTALLGHGDVAVSSIEVRQP